jgi:hypothetical protein
VSRVRGAVRQHWRLKQAWKASAIARAAETAAGFGRPLVLPARPERHSPRAEEQRAYQQRRHDAEQEQRRLPSL